MKTILMVSLLSWQLTAHASTPAEMALKQVTGLSRSILKLPSCYLTEAICLSMCAN